MMRHLFFLFFCITALSVGYAQQAEHLLSVDTDNIKTQRLEVEETYSQSFPISSQKTASLEIKVGNRISLKEIARISLPFLVTTAYGLFRHNNSASGLENKSDRFNLAPYAVGGAIVSGASFALRTHRKKALAKLTYHNLSGAVVQTESQWITMGKPTTINIKNNIDGWVDVTVSASKYQTIKVQYINFVSEDISSVQVDKNEERTSSSRLSFEKINLKDSSNLFNNLINKYAISLVPNISTQFDWQTAFSKSDSIVLDTAISNSSQVVCYETYECFYRPDFSGSGAYAHYEISERGHCSNVFINVSTGHRYYLQSERYTGISCKPSFDDDDPNDPPGPGPGPGPGTNPTDPNDDNFREIIRTSATRVASYCEGIKKLWSWSYRNNNPYTTVEMAGYELADGTFLILPWGSNTGTSCHYFSAGSTSSVTDANAVYEYSVQTGSNGQAVIQRYNVITHTSEDIPIVSYVHTHPYDYNQGYAVNDPTYSTPQQAYGDWQLSADRGIPGKIIGPDKIIKFHYDANQTEPRVKDSEQNKNTVCP